MSNKILVVGTPRSGTSWVMQTLFHLHIPIFGIPNPANRDPSMQPNNKPFWEHPSALSGNLSCLGNSYCAIKVLVESAIKKVTLDPTDKVIICNRDVDKVAASMVTCIGRMNHSQHVERINKHKIGLMEWVGDTPYILTDIDWARDNKIEAITAIKEFVGSMQDITDAIKNLISY